MSQKNFNEVVSHMKNYGFVFQDLPQSMLWSIL